MAEARDRPKRLTILGATGSIGRSTFEVIEGRPGAYSVEAVTANRNAEELARIARTHRARLAVVAEPDSYLSLKAALSGSGIEAAAGPEAIDGAAAGPADLVVAAMVGAAGLRPTMAAVGAGRDIALANKECLVCAGALFMAAIERGQQRLLPVDSEHNAIFQALDHNNRNSVEKVVLTASGGPFRTWTAERMKQATAADALKHPRWSMGAKVTVDSATMMNKGLEVIEAHHLFGLADQQIGVAVHPESVVHGLVFYGDGSVIAQMAAPDMRTPIAHCLGWPERSKAPSKRLDLIGIGSLTFENPDISRFPALKIARETLALGGSATNIMNAANEVAVAAFLDGRIGYLDIAGLVTRTLDAWLRRPGRRDPESIAEAVALDGEGRRLAGQFLVPQGAV